MNHAAVLQSPHPSATAPKSLGWEPPTFGEIKAHFNKVFSAEVGNPQIVLNRMSMLSTYLAWCRRTDDDRPGREFGMDFDRNLAAWCDDMRREGRADRTIGDRCAWLLKWRDLIVGMARVDTLPEPFAEALKEAISRSKIPYSRLAASLGMSDETLASWAKGKCLPQNHAMQRIAGLEKALHLPTDTLKNRLGFITSRKESRALEAAGEFSRSSYASRVSENERTGWTVQIMHNPPEQLRAEWKTLMAFKTDALRKNLDPKAVWRAKPIRLSTATLTWFWQMDNLCVPTAAVSWSFVSRFFSWLCLPREEGGVGVPFEQVNSLAIILNEKYVTTYMQFLMNGAGGMPNSGMTSVLAFFCSLLRPTQGWLWLNPNLAHSLHPRQYQLDLDLTKSSASELTEAWQSECERLYKTYRSMADSIEKHKNHQMSRDPVEPIDDILALERPLSALIEMFVELRGNYPPAYRRLQHAIRLRDTAMFALLTAVPLRVSHLTTITYEPDNTGRLRQGPDGSWLITLPAIEMKNGKVYKVELPQYAGEALSTYIREGRPHLNGHDECNFLFLSHAKRRRVKVGAKEIMLGWHSDGISERIRKLTGYMRKGKCAFGPHAFRHIVATDYLKRHPGAYQLVAELLNDSLRTVLKQYGHVKPDDGLRLHHQAAEEELRLAMA